MTPDKTNTQQLAATCETCGGSKKIWLRQIHHSHAGSAYDHPHPCPACSHPDTARLDVQGEA